jgi:hypothetical protein
MIPVEHSRFTNSRFPRGWPANLVHLPESVRPEPHRVLRISRHEKDLVRIIRAAQIQLRYCRRQDSLTEQTANPAQSQAQSQAKSQAKTRRRIMEIITARDTLLAAAFTRITIPDMIPKMTPERRFLSRLP